MVEHVDVHRGRYHDSVSLMQVSRTVGEVDGVEAALVAMATELNLGFLDSMGFDPAAAGDAGPNDLLVAIRATDDDALATGLRAVEAALAAASSGRSTADLGGAPPPRTFRTATRFGAFDLALISVPGEYAFVEAADALDAGLSVMVFSDNVAVEHEIELKRRAAERDRLVMGPDCGTAIVGGIGLGFANVVARGPVGVVAASGTGAQQLTCLLDDAGVGVSHVLGVGGRDLKAEVGGASTLQALAALDADPATELIVLLSKPPAAEVADRVKAAATACATPVVFGFLGPGASDLTAVAAETVRALGRSAPEPAGWPAPGGDRAPRPGRLVGLFAGGTLCAEALMIATDHLGAVQSNIAGDPALALQGAITADSHVLIDLGEDEYTRGRPHPMIDQSLRLERLEAEAARADTAVMLLDVVLGHGAHPDPAGELAPAITAAIEQARAAGRDLAVVVSLCGTAGDPQGRDRQAEVLQRAGASVHLSNAAAAREAVRLIEGARS